MFTTIVVPLDGSPIAGAALGPAASLARRCGAGLELVVVSSPGLPTREDELLLEEAATTVTAVTTSCVVIKANDEVAALAEITARDDVLLCMATHGRGGVARALIGSTAEAVLRAVSAPVLLIGPSVVVPASWDVVQACVDPTSSASRRTVPVALAMARTLGARLWLVEVANPRELPPPDDLVEAGGLAAMASTLAGDGVAVDWDVFHGDDVAGELLRAEADVGASLLVAATHNRAGLARFALGSVSLELVRRATCPVLVIPPVHEGG